MSSFIAGEQNVTNEHTKSSKYTHDKINSAESFSNLEEPSKCKNKCNIDEHAANAEKQKRKPTFYPAPKRSGCGMKIDRGALAMLPLNFGAQVNW